MFSGTNRNISIIGVRKFDRTQILFVFFHNDTNTNIICVKKFDRMQIVFGTPLTNTNTNNTEYE